MARDPKALIEEVRRLDRAATPRPWRTERYYKPGEESMRSDNDPGCKGIWNAENDEIVTTDAAVYGPTWGDAQLMARSRTLLPELADALDAARERIAELEAALRPFADGCLVQRGSPKWDLQDPPDPNCCCYCAARAALGGKK